MKARLRHGAALVALLALLPLGGGCVWAPELAAVKTDIARQFPDTTFRKNVTLSFGPVTMALARAVTGLVPAAHEARGYLRDVSRLQVAVYEMDGTPATAGMQTPARIQELLDEGWEMALRVRDDREMVWLLYRIDDESVREMFVIAMDDEELVLVKLKGRLERTLAQALSDANGDGFVHNYRGRHHQ